MLVIVRTRKLLMLIQHLFNLTQNQSFSTNKTNKEDNNQRKGKLNLLFTTNQIINKPIELKLSMHRLVCCIKKVEMKLYAEEIMVNCFCLILHKSSLDSLLFKLYKVYQ